MSSSRRVGFVPEWLSAEVQDALAAIDGDHVAKKQQTVLLLAQATATDQAWADVFERKDTCTSGKWYGWTHRSTGETHAGWQDDPAIAHALKVATKRARWWMLVKHGRAVETALDTIVEAAPEAALQLVRMATRGVIRAQNIETDELADMPVPASEVTKAINSVLDRADAKTASKGRMELTGADGGPIRVKDEQPDLSKLGTEELLALRELLAKAAPDEAAESG